MAETEPAERIVLHGLEYVLASTVAALVQQAREDALRLAAGVAYGYATDRTDDVARGILGLAAPAQPGGGDG